MHDDIQVVITEEHIDVTIADAIIEGRGPTGAQGEKGEKGDPGTTDYNELENLPDLTLKADKATTYTKTEVDTALAGKANTVHTHVASDVTDFNSSVSSNSDVSANTTARHTHANKTILDATSASYTTADKTKLDGIEAGAEVNTVTSVNTRTGAVTGLAETSDLTAHTGNTSNPHQVTKAQVGLGNVDNTSDANKPVSTATTNALNLKAPIASPTFTGIVSGITKAMVGLSNVDNTSDTNKPVSTAQQTALNAKADDTAVMHKTGTETIAGAKTFTDNMTIALGKTVIYSAQTGDSSITRNNTYQALDDYSRAWEAWLDKNGRNQAAAGWHGVNSGDGITHNAWEVKTSVSPTNPSPLLMQTRIGIQSDKDKADFVMNYLDTLRLYKGDGSSTQTVNIIADTGNIDTLGAQTSKDAEGTSYITMYKKATAGSMIQAAELTGSATLDFEATPLDGTSSSVVRLFRNTNTMNTGTGFFIYNATNANVVQHFLGAKGNTYFNSFGGSFMIGKSSSPQAKLDVNGDVQVAGRIKGVSTPTTGTDAATKDYVDTANAMKVNKAGDTMTGKLGSTATVIGFGQTRSGNEIAFGTNGSGRFQVYNNTSLANIAEFYPDGSRVAFGTNGVGFIYGNGFPNGVVSASVGSIYIDTAVTNGASSWIKKSGTGNTGWKVLEGDTGWRNVTSTFSSQWAVVNANDYGVYMRRAGNSVELSIKAAIASGWIGTSIALPTGFKFGGSIGMNPPIAILNLWQTAGSGSGVAQIGGTYVQVTLSPSTAGTRYYGSLTGSTLEDWPVTLPGIAV